MTEVPAAPLIQAIEQRRQTFQSLKGTAVVRVAKRGHSRTLENVGIVLDGQKRLRIEAFGPLGQSTLALVWDGQEMQLRLPDSNKVVRTGPWGLERLLGAGIEVQELSAALSGNIPETDPTDGTKAFCGPDESCIVELVQGETVRRVRVSPASGQDQHISITSSELYHSGSLVFRARFEQPETISNYQVPTRVIIECPDKKLTLTVSYDQVDVNAPVGDEAFQPLEGEDALQ